MSEIDRRLSEVFAADAPPARDPAFVFRVLQAEERRRLGLEMLLQGAATTAGAGLLWAALPWLSDAVQSATPVLSAFSLAMSVVVGGLILLRLWSVAQMRLWSGPAPI
ncbi:MAG: hypothetical protein JSR45_15120 [Proteobacteria bacterium]|nr:hypothetical protein [Pseudomonadota bacterium]